LTPLVVTLAERCQPKNMGLSFKKIDDRRREIGIPVSRFAKSIGVSRNTYYGWGRDVLPILGKYSKIIEGTLCVDINDISEEDKEKLPKELVRGLSIDLNKRISRVRWAINYIISENNLSNNKLAKILELSVSTIDNYRRGIKMPKFETLTYFQNHYRISIDWIMDGEGEPFFGARAKYPEICGPEAPMPPSFPAPPCNPPEAFVFVRQMTGSISAGGGTVPEDTADMCVAFRKDWMQRKGSPDKMSLIKVSGDSMEPTLLSGDLVLVDHGRNSIASQGGIYAISIDDEIMIKRVQPSFPDKLLIISDNKQYAPYKMSTANVRVNGKVIWYARDLER